MARLKARAMPCECHRPLSLVEQGFARCVHCLRASRERCVVMRAGTSMVRRSTDHVRASFIVPKCTIWLARPIIHSMKARTGRASAAAHFASASLSEQRMAKPYRVEMARLLHRTTRHRQRRRRQWIRRASRALTSKHGQWRPSCPTRADAFCVCRVGPQIALIQHQRTRR